ncbi:MAG: TetR/AcrR family transcriptional regulator [Actinomycetaceae bacterium]|nr:TetR/AcrR family transcriptional regulator [Actinomycetaceae bacterium]
MGNRLKTQEQLIAATRDIIIDEGIEYCSLENICQKAGFTRGAFYSNFGTKEALFCAVAEDEYTRLIYALRDQVHQWQTHRSDEDHTHTDSTQKCSPGKAPHLIMEDLLFQAVDAMGFDKSLYILHSELLTRSIRHPQWGALLYDINNEFIQAISEALTTILHLAQREPTRSMRTVTHTVIAIAIRASGIDALRRITEMRGIQQGASPAPHLPQTTDDTGSAHVSQSVRTSPARNLIEMILLVLYGASRPVTHTD